MSTNALPIDRPAPGPAALATADPGAPTVASARRGVLAYLLLLVVLTAMVDAAIFATGQRALFMVLMWMPALASILVRLVRREGFADVSFRFGGRRTWVALLLALLLPFAVGLVAYGLAWSIGLATFAPPATLPLLGDVSGLGPAVRFLLLTGVILVAVLPVALVTATGEEIGWRGYFVLRLLDARVPHAIAVSGVIWGLWHVPLIVTGLYAAGPNPLLSAAIFIVMVVAITVPMSWARLATGSIWPAAFLHGAWNTIIQGAFDPSTVGPNALVWTGESGVLTAATLAVLAVLISRQHWPVLRTPPRPGVASVFSDRR
ncbi:MAG: CPBP family intramembrane glutamic endopeptidase [Geminicoccaceae bacterium]